MAEHLEDPMTDQPAHTDCHSAYESCAACAWEDGYRQGIQAGREAAAKAIEAACPDPVWHGECAHKALAAAARGDQEGGGTDG